VPSRTASALASVDRLQLARADAPAGLAPAGVAGVKSLVLGSNTLGPAGGLDRGLRAPKDDGRSDRLSEVPAVVRHTQDCRLDNHINVTPVPSWGTTRGRREQL
jgi:hypothetical protein